MRLDNKLYYTLPLGPNTAIRCFMWANDRASMAELERCAAAAWFDDDEADDLEDVLDRVRRHFPAMRDVLYTLTKREGTVTLEQRVHA